MIVFQHGLVLGNRPRPLVYLGVIGQVVIGQVLPRPLACLSSSIARRFRASSSTKGSSPPSTNARNRCASWRAVSAVHAPICPMV
jgi:hypothetical protein